MLSVLLRQDSKAKYSGIMAAQKYFSVLISYYIYPAAVTSAWVVDLAQIG